MSISYPFQKSHTAEAALTLNRIVKPGVAAGAVVLAAGAADKSIGVVNEVAAVVGERQDVIKHGPAVVEAGAAFAWGDPLTSDALGRAVVAATIGQRIIGFADEAATAVGDVVRLIVNPGVL